MFGSVTHGQVKEGSTSMFHSEGSDVRIVKRFGLIRELRLSTNYYHCITDGSTKLDYDKCILISMESSLNERLASEALVIFGSLTAEFMYGKVSCAGFCRQAFLCPASNFPRP